jgi:hypothetical protein
MNKMSPVLTFLLKSLYGLLGWVQHAFIGMQGFVSGALVGTIITVVVVGVRARRERQIAALQEQLRLLYGPVAVLARQNEQLFQFTTKIDGANAKISDAYSKCFAPGVEVNETRQEALLRAGERTTNLANLYVKRVIKNNSRVMQIIDANWHLVEAIDRDTFSQFQFEYIRYLVEYKQKGLKEVPLSVLMDIGPQVAFMRPEMMARINEVFLSKQKSLEKARGRWL